MPTWNTSSGARRMLAQKCHYCKFDAETRDHIVPRALGGRNAQFNLVPSCRPCNEAKADRMPTCTCRKCKAAVRTWDIEQEVARVDKFLNQSARPMQHLPDQGDAIWNGGAR